MTGRACGRPGGSFLRPPPRPVFREPVMRVWHHTAQGGTVRASPGPDDLHSVLARQCQLLAEIRELLEQLTAEPKK